MMYLGKMNFRQFAAVAQSFRAPIIERTEHIDDNVAMFNYFYLADTNNQVYFKCDNIYVWMHSPLPDNVVRALNEAKSAIGARTYLETRPDNFQVISQLAGRCGKRL